MTHDLPAGGEELRDVGLMARAYLVIESARAYGFIDGGPGIDVERCEEIGRGRGGPPASRTPRTKSTPRRSSSSHAHNAQGGDASCLTRCAGACAAAASCECSFAECLRGGWPTCCGQTMSLVHVEDGQIEKAVARATARRSRTAIAVGIQRADGRRTVSADVVLTGLTEAEAVAAREAAQRAVEELRASARTTCDYCGQPVLRPDSATDEPMLEPDPVATADEGLWVVGPPAGELRSSAGRPPAMRSTSTWPRMPGTLAESLYCHAA
jgi:hypothetical protein